jgi:predicted GIY-YIG superfamily endonuclease
MYPFIIFMNIISYVYKITSPSNKYYIGSTNNLKRRPKQHFYGGVNAK